MSEISYREKCLKQKISVCSVCGDNEKLYVHHIDGNRSNNKLKNLIPLCPTCHRKVHSHKSHGKQIDKYTSKLPQSAINEGPGSKDVEYTTGNSETATTTVQMDKRGRVVIPQAVRDKLDIDGENATVELIVKTDE